MIDSIKLFLAKNKKLAYISALLFTGILWSTGGVLVKYISYNPLSITSARSLIVSIIFLLYLKKPSLSFNKPMVGGAVSYAILLTLCVISTRLTTAANAILLQYSAPVFIAILAGWLLNEKTSKADWIAVGVVICGMVLFFMDDISSGTMTGNILAIVSGLSYAMMVIFLRMQKNTNPMHSVFWGNVLTFFIGLPWLLSEKPDITSILGLLFLGIFQLGLPYLLYSFLIKHVNALEATITTTIEPILNPVWVSLFIGETPGFYSLMGGGIVLLTLIIRSIISHAATSPKVLEEVLVQKSIQKAS